MSDLRYPVGKVELTKDVTDAMRAQWIQEIAEAPAKLRAAVGGLSDAQLDTPYRPDGWTVRQVVHHVVDSQINAYVRFKLAVTEDCPTLGMYEQSLWAELPDAKTGPPAGSLTILDALHGRWVSFLRALTPEQCERRVVHRDKGEITVDVLLEHHSWHCTHHEAHITGLRERMGW